MLTTERDNSRNEDVENRLKKVERHGFMNPAEDEPIHQLPNQTSSLACGGPAQPANSTTEYLQMPTPNPTPDLNSENRKLLSKLEKASKKNDP